MAAVRIKVFVSVFFSDSLGQGISLLKFRAFVILKQAKAEEAALKNSYGLSIDNTTYSLLKVNQHYF
jgi:hypothetical protein